jgi:hypothetical protein
MQLLLEKHLTAVEKTLIISGPTPLAGLKKS